MPASSRPEARVGEAEHVLRYALEARDILAWQRVAPALRKRDRLALAASVLAGFGALQALSGKLETVPGLHSLPAALVILALPPLALALFQRRDRRRRAEAQVGGPDARVAVRLEVWPDRIVEHRADLPAPRVFGARSLRDLREAGGQVLMSFGGEDVVILPGRAFADAGQRAEFVAQWRAQLG